ncbi:hypothetical protein RND81_05G060200 [Saponaria officinalis]|uniref:ATP-dependent DNA helicase n=1 Tax=Saponaria officinalis TaxID=3572 RepID=A0AAW1KUY9_SAPOF
MMFSFTSMGGKIDRSINQGRGPYTFKMGGQNVHLIGSLLPMDENPPKFAQLYIYDTNEEVQNRKTAVGSSNQQQFLDDLIRSLKEMIDQHNPLAATFRMARDRLALDNSGDVKMRLINHRDTDGRTYNLPTASEVAALVVGDIGITLEKRDIIIEKQCGTLNRISELHPSYLALQYPLLFPYGEDGFRLGITHSETSLRASTSTNPCYKLTMREWFAYRIQDRPSTIEAPTLLLAGRLFQQFCVDGYTAIESGRLSYLRFNQKKLRTEKYKNLSNVVDNGDTDPSSVGGRIILPSKFLGCDGYMRENYHDTMAICRWTGYPDLFITFTCNPKWPEITRFVQQRGIKPEDRPDILCRIFKIKLQRLMKDLKFCHLFGRTRGVVYTIEFQKRGLPHAHILLFLHRENKFPEVADVDRVISAEIPDPEQNPELYEVVKEFMIHGPCGNANRRSPCMIGNQCSKHFPKKFQDRTTVNGEGYPIYMRRDNGFIVEKNGVELDNRFVVPYNPTLLLKYRAHINVEWCNQSRSIKYLFKYINKGYDRVTVLSSHNRANEQNPNQVDEIQNYYDCRYISSCEAVWRIFGFEIHYRTPPVERLSFHLPDEQSVLFNDNEFIDAVVEKPLIDRTMFLSWMECNKIYPYARELTYSEFPTKFSWHKDKKEWCPRKSGFSIGRIYHVAPGCGERYYMRTLLNFVKGPRSFKEIRIINGITYPTYKEACYALGLLGDDKEYVDAIIEASFWASGFYLRNLFVTLLLSNSILRPDEVWDKTWHLLSDDILYKRRNILQNQELRLNDEDLKNYTLLEIEASLKSNGSTLRRFDNMSFPISSTTSESGNKLILDELSYDKKSLHEEHIRNLSCLTDEQRLVYDEIMDAANHGRGGIFFVYGFGGTGKTFVWRTLCAAIRSKGEIVLPVASSGIAAMLLPGGRTTHSRFGISINVVENFTCPGIKPGAEVTELLHHTKLIIWDEAPMMHRYCFEALDRSLRDVMRFSTDGNSDLPFGGKVVVFGGDFRQILPVVPKGSRQDFVYASLSSSSLWSSCKVGLDNDGEVILELPDEILIKNTRDPIASIVASTYPSLETQLGNSQYFQERAILAPTHDIVELVNDYVLSLIPGEEKIYLSSDEICKEDSNTSVQQLFSTECLNTLRCSGLPNHVLKLKVGATVMLLRNIDQSSGLCNGTRLVVTNLGSRVIGATVISGSSVGEKVLIPRISLTPSDTNKFPVKFERRQFPLTVCFAMTINKSQGQSLANVGLYLPRPVFSHGQLYVAISRVTSKRGLKILICDEDGQTSNYTSNVVYKEIFQHL